MCRQRIICVLRRSQGCTIHQQRLRISALHLNGGLHEALNRVGNIVALVEHIGGREALARAGGLECLRRVNQFVKYQKQPERLDRPGVEIIVTIFAVVEMEARQFIKPHQTRHDLLNINVWRVVAKINQTFRLGPKLLRRQKAGTPIGNDRGIKRRFEHFMLQKHLPIGGEPGINLMHRLQVAVKSLGQVGLSGKIRAITNPHSQRLGAKLLPERNAFQIVGNRQIARFGIGVGERTKLIGMRLPGLILKCVGIYGVKTK